MLQTSCSIDTLMLISTMMKTWRSCLQVPVAKQKLRWLVEIAVKVLVEGVRVPRVEVALLHS